MEDSSLLAMYRNFANDCYDNNLDLATEVKNEIKEIIESNLDIDEKVDKIFSLNKATSYEWV